MLQPLDAAAVRRVGPYVTVAVIGSGGMGSVQLARRAAPGPATPGTLGNPATPVLAAVKTIHDGLGIDDGFRVRFRREAEAARAVRGPYTAALLDADPDGNPPWLATEYVPGPSLAEAVTRLGPLPLPVLRALGADLARALRTVHGARLLHRDLKPANVLLSAGGPKLIDFGIARAFDGTVLTAAGQVIGTPGFMSPEQVAGRDDIGPASDVFALGGLLCWAATGRGPFDDPELAAVFSRISEGRADLAGLPDELREVVTACLAVDPAARPTTDDLVRALDARAAGERPGAALAHRDGPFPWSPGVSELIGTYEAETRRLLASAPPEPPPTPPVGAGPVFPPPGQGATPPPPATTPSRDARNTRSTRNRRRATIAATAVAGALALVAGLLVGLGYFDDDGRNDDAGRGPRPSSSPPPPPVDGVETVSGGDVLGAPHTLSYPAPSGDGVPHGWKPWRVAHKDRISNCVLQEDLLICTGGGHATAYRTSDGSTVWRSPNTGLIPGMSHDRVYLGEGEGVLVAQRSDGKPLGRWPGAAGFAPTRTLVAGGVVYVGYLGDAGVGTANEMMFRAYRESDGSMLWESIVNQAYPWGLTLLGDKLYIPTAGPLAVLDPKTGKSLSEKEICTDPVVSLTGTMHCNSTMDGKIPDPVVAAASDDVVIAQAGLEPGEVRLYAATASTGKVQWTRPIATAGESFDLGNTLVVGDRVVVATSMEVASYGLKDGEPLGKPVPATWRIPQDDPRDQPRFLVAGDVFFLAWGDSIVSARIPR